MEEEKEEVIQDPEKTETPVEPVEKVEPTTELPDWFLKDKYKTIEDQAKSVTSAVQKMKEVEDENKNLRETNENLLMAEETRQQKPQSDMSHTEEEIANLETKFGMPYAQIKANWDMQTLIQNNALAPVKNAILSQQYDSTLNQLEQGNPLFKQYRGQVEAKLAGKPIEVKATKQAIKSAWDSVIADNIGEIRANAIEEGRKAITASPETIPDVTSANKTVETSIIKEPLPDDVKAYLTRVGANPEEVEKFHNENGTKEKGEQTGWNKMFA